MGQDSVVDLQNVPPPMAPPPAPGWFYSSSPENPTLSEIHSGPRRKAGLTSLPLWDIGEPTDEEQSLLEWVNRARLDPFGEIDRMRNIDDPHAHSAYNYFLVDLDVFAQDMMIFDPQPPLAFEPRLIAAARGHSQWMLENVTQTHYQGDITIGDRVTAEGYPWRLVSENVFSYARSVPHAHASFEVDWGLLDPVTGQPLPPGMQEPPGHRLANHNGEVREIGIGFVLGTNQKVVEGKVSTVGPMVVTMNFADRTDLPALITGVAFYDLNTNHEYDLGEGLGGIRVEVDAGTFEARTSRSGGYALPGTVGVSRLRFLDGTTLIAEHDVPVTSGVNVKVDLMLAYDPPELVPQGIVQVGRTGRLIPSRVIGATAYAWEQISRTPFSEVLGAEPGQTGFETQTSPGYAVVQSERKASGNWAFHFATPEPEEQVLLLTHRFVGGNAPELRFASLLAGATETQVAFVEVSTDEGKNWEAVWQQAGSGFPGESNFRQVTVPLPGLVEREFIARFRYDVVSGNYYNQTISQVGFFVDDIEWSDVFQVEPLGSGVVTADEPVIFDPQSEGIQWWRARALVGDRELNWSGHQAIQVHPFQEDTEIRIVTLERLGSGRLRLVGTADSVSGLQLETMNEWGGDWGVLPDVDLMDLGSNQFEWEWEPQGTQGWFRIRRP